MGYVYGFDDYNSNDKIIADIVMNNSVDDAIEILEKNNITDAREVVYDKLGDNVNSYPAPWVLFWSANMSVSKNMLLKIGLFDESYTTWGGEDNDLALALYTNNAEFILGRDLKSIHYPHEKTHNIIKDPNLAKKELIKKQEYLLSKYKIDTIKEWFVTHELELNQKLKKA